MIRASLGLLLFLIGSSVHASPLLHFQLEGRRQGSDDSFASNVEVSLGDVVEYRLRLKLAAPGTTNQHLRPNDGPRPTKHGLNSMSAVITQAAGDPIQINLSLPATLAGENPADPRRGWGSGTGARGGQPSLRPGTSWHDLTDIRPIQGPGVFTGAAEETILSGLFNVAAISGPSGQLSAEWGGISGAGWFDGQLFFVTGRSWTETDYRTEASSDPIAQFAPLTLIAGNFEAVPEPSTIVMAASALATLFWFLKSLRRATQPN